MFAALFSPSPSDAAALLACARDFSPRVERQMGGRLLLVDATGLDRIVGNAESLARELQQAVRGFCAHVAVAPSRTAALLLPIARDYTVVAPGRNAAALAALDLSVFDTLATLYARRPCALCLLCTASHRQARMLCGVPGGACRELATLRRWGLRTLGDLAALPAAALASRLGQVGVALHRLARGVDAQPLVPVIEEERFEASLDLEWPIEDLQPLSFVLARLLEPLSSALERADRGAAAIETTLALVTRDTHARRLELPAPMRDPRVLRTLILLDLESHPPSAGIDRIAVRIDPTPGRIVQFALFERAGAQPETVATLVARLTALMGEGRVGSPVLVDSHEPAAFAMGVFRSEGRGQRAEGRVPTLPASPSLTSPLTSALCPLTSVIRRFRIPVAARVTVARGRPVCVVTDRRGIAGGAVEQWSGPWRSSGHWWRHGVVAWNRDEWDVTLGDGGAYRIYRDREGDRWFIEGILD